MPTTYEEELNHVGICRLATDFYVAKYAKVTGTLPRIWLYLVQLPCRLLAFLVDPVS